MSSQVFLGIKYCQCALSSMLTAGDVHMQVIKLLEAMDLQQYVETFRQQHVDGDILSDCDEDILQNELKIQSRLHRLRLQRVISGQYAVANMIPEQDYVVMQPLCY